MEGVAIVGGGPAGLMAAEVLATSGAGVPVTVFERMPSVGRKFQLAGRGGLNLTHTEALEALLDRYADAAAALAPAVRAFDPTALRAWSASLGQRTVVGTSGRVFPEAFRATPLLRAWIGRLQDLGVEILVRHRWSGWEEDGRLRFGRADGTSVAVAPRATVLALGGASWPRTGSDGGWVGLVETAGIDVAPLRPANSGFLVAWSEHFRARFGGAPLKNVRLEVGGAAVRGDLVVTATGIEGGAVYAIGRDLRGALDRAAPALVRLDLKPDLSEAELAARLTARRRPKDSSSTTLRRAAGLAPAAIGLLREQGPMPDGAVGLARRIKSVPLEIRGVAPLDRAISTAGGIARHEIDDRFMLHRRPGTFVAGEMIDWDAPTGGYLLQATFSTAVAAARGVLSWLDR